MALKTNSNTEDFGDVQGSGGVTISHASVIYNIGVTDAVAHPLARDRQFCYWTGAIANSRTLAQGDAMEFPAGAIDITLPAGALQNVGVQHFSQSALDDLGSPTVLLGTGDMGANGTANEVADAGYTRQVVEMEVTA